MTKKLGVLHVLICSLFDARCKIGLKLTCMSYKCLIAKSVVALYLLMVQNAYK